MDGSLDKIGGKEMIRGRRRGNKWVDGGEHHRDRKHKSTSCGGQCRPWLSLREGAPKGLGTCVNEGLEVLPSIND
jgi:hypothetical protein